MKYSWNRCRIFSQMRFKKKGKCRPVHLVRSILICISSMKICNTSCEVTAADGKLIFTLLQYEHMIQTIPLYFMVVVVPNAVTIRLNVSGVLGSQLKSDTYRTTLEKGQNQRTCNLFNLAYPSTTTVPNAAYVLRDL